MGRLPRSTAFLGAGPVERPDDGYVTLLEALGFRIAPRQDDLIELARLGYISGLRWTAANERVMQAYEKAVRDYNQLQSEARDLYIGPIPDRPVYEPGTEPVVEEGGIRVTESGWSALAAILSSLRPTVSDQFDDELHEAWTAIEHAMRQQTGRSDTGDDLIAAYCDAVGAPAFTSIMRDELRSLFHYIRSEKALPVAADDCRTLLVHLACVLESVRSTAGPR